MKETAKNRKNTHIKPNEAITSLLSVAACALAVFLFILTSRQPCENEIVAVSLNAACLLCASGLAAFDPEMKTRYRMSLVGFLLSAILIALYIIAEKYGLIKKAGDGEVIRSVILSSGRWGIACFFALTYLSVVILPVPAAVLIVAGTYVYGPWISFAVSASATFVGSLTCFYLGRKLGKKLLFWLFDREKVEKYATILGEKGKIPFIATMFLPFFPDDLICISAGVTDMKFGFFAISTLFARSAYVFAVSVLGGGEIIPFRGWGIAAWVGIFAACVLAFVIISKRISSKKKA